MKLFCKLGLHRFVKIDKNINHDFLVCEKCGKRKFKFKRAFDQKYHWDQNNDFSARPIIEMWVNGTSWKETEKKIMARYNKKYGFKYD